MAFTYDNYLTRYFCISLTALYTFLSDQDSPIALIMTVSQSWSGFRPLIPTGTSWIPLLSFVVLDRLNIE